MDARSAGFETIKSVSVEPNNNETLSVDPAIISSDSRTCTEVSDRIRMPSKFGKQHSLQDLFFRKNTENISSAFQRERSNSDGAAISLINNADSVTDQPNAILDKFGLCSEATREHLNEESLEQKFTSLALACTIDSATIKNRCERQKRTRDQTEVNFNLEVDKLKEKLALLQPLCTDFETADLLSTLFAQVEILMKAASLVSIAAERFGAVQHEERLTDSVQLMISYVQALKQQRDSARRQLQYTKRVLQEPVQPTGLNTSNQKTFTSLNKKLISKRRASTDSVNFNSQHSDQNFKLNRRISDVPFRASLAKTRPSRLDLGMELNKIKENALDEGTKDDTCKTLETNADLAKDDFDSDTEMNSQVKAYLDKPHCYDRFVRELSHIVRLKIGTYTQNVQRKLSLVFKKWSQNGYMHAFLNSWAVLCFFISVLTLASIFLEQEYTKAPTYWMFPWLKRKD